MHAMKSTNTINPSDTIFYGPYPFNVNRYHALKHVQRPSSFATTTISLFSSFRYQMRIKVTIDAVYK